MMVMVVDVVKIDAAIKSKIALYKSTGQVIDWLLEVVCASMTNKLPRQ